MWRLAWLSCCLSLGAAVLPAFADSSPEAADEKQIKEELTALNLAFKNRDVDALKRLMTDDHVAITPYYDMPQTKTEQIRTLGDYELTEYLTGKLTITFLSDKIALVTYPLTLKGTVKKIEVVSRNQASTIWVKTDGKWRERFYQETPLKGK